MFIGSIQFFCKSENWSSRLNANSSPRRGKYLDLIHQVLGSCKILDTFTSTVKDYEALYQVIYAEN